MIRSNVNPVPFYDRLGRQHHRKPYAYGAALPIVVERDFLPPFQLTRTPATGAAITTMTLVRVEDGATFNILTDATSTGLEVVNLSEYDLIIYPATVSLPGEYNEGVYYLIISDGTWTRYSDYFSMRQDVSRMVKVEWWHNQDFEYPGGKFRYNAPYKNYTYFPTEIGKPVTQFEDVTETRQGRNLSIQKIRYKQFFFEVITYEEVIDMLSLVALHDHVRVYKDGLTYEVDEFLPTETWQQQGDLATVEVEFRTDTVVVVNGRGLEDISYEVGAACITPDFSCVGYLIKDSAQWTAFEYTDANGDTQSLVTGNNVLALNGSNLEVYQFSGAGYLLQGWAALATAYVISTNTHYAASSAATFVLPSITGFSDLTDPTTVFGIGIDGADHDIFVVYDDGREVRIGTTTATQLGLGYQVAVPEQGVYLRMKIRSVNCGIFYEDSDYTIPWTPSAAYPGPYAGDTAAGADGVIVGGFYRLANVNDYDMPTAEGRLIVGRTDGGSVGAGGPYADDAAAATGGIALGGAYYLSDANNYDMPNAAGRLIVIRTDDGAVGSYPGPYAGDGAAQIGGVGVGEAYLLAKVNDYDMPTAGGRVLVIRIT